MKWLVLFFMACGIAHADTPANRLATLAHGVNVTTVFDPEAFPQLLKDMPTIAELDFRHIRIFIDPEWVLSWNDADVKRQQLDRAVDTALENNLGVILCMAGAGWTDQVNDAFVARWISAWKTLATHYHRVPPDKMFYEIVNEPTLTDVSRWAAYQETIRQALRTVAPINTLLLTSTPDSTVWGLSALKPNKKDGDVVYTFHLYQPMLFSHQGADWGGIPPSWTAVQGLEYPPNPANLAAMRRKVPSVIGDLAKYEKDGSHAIAKEVKVGADWSKKNNTRVVVTEFGVYRPAPPASRAAWLEEARKALESAGFGWSVWEWDSGFGVKPDLKGGCSSRTQSPMFRALDLCQP